MSESNNTDPCASWGIDQKLAVVWFVIIIAIGVGLTTALKNTDSYNYNHNGEFFDYKAYKENRLSQSSIPSDDIDKRAQGDIVSTQNNLK